MPITTDGLMMEPEQRDIRDYAASRAESLGATAAEAWTDNPLPQLLGIGEMSRAKGEVLAPDTDPFGNVIADQSPPTPPAPRIGMDQARAQVKQRGLDGAVQLPDAPDIAAPALDLMLSRAQARREREATIARGPDGIVQSALSVGTSFLVGAADPLNIAASFIPVVGEARYGKLMADAGESLLARTAVRAGVGGAQGVVGQAAITPLDWYAHTQEGRDYRATDALHGLIFGGLLGAGLHAGGGALSDAWRARHGVPLYPFGPGEPMENVAGHHVPAELLSDDGVSADLIDRHVNGNAPPLADIAAPLAAIDDLPPQAHEDAARATIADLIEGRQVSTAEMVAAAGDSDPRIASSFEAFHGSAHDFDMFETSRIGSGEGAQVYGHGLYFAERPETAATYSSMGDDHLEKASLRIGSERRAYADLNVDEKQAWREVNDAGGIDKAIGGLTEAIARGPDPWTDEAALDGFRRSLDLIEGWKRDRAEVDNGGNVYKVRINANPDHFLDWDKPISDQAPEVRAALTKLGIDGTNTVNGEEAYREIARQNLRYGEPDSNGFRRDVGPSAASRALQEAGIPGIRYLDAGSRDAGEGTRNFVVFNDKDIEITHKNGEVVRRQDLARTTDADAQIRAVPATGNSAEVTRSRQSAWNDLADNPPAYDQPDAVAASRVADAAPDQLPPSAPPSERLQKLLAADRASADLYAAKAPFLSEEERARVDDTLRVIDLDESDMSTILSQGAACLARAAGVA